MKWRKVLSTACIKNTYLIIFPFFVLLAGKVGDVDEDNSLLSMTTSQDGLPPPDPLRVDWPKVIHLHFTTCMSKLDANTKEYLC